MRFLPHFNSVRDFWLMKSAAAGGKLVWNTHNEHQQKCIYLGATSFVLYFPIVAQQRKSKNNFCTLRVSHDIKIKAHATAFLLWFLHNGERKRAGGRKEKGSYIIWEGASPEEGVARALCCSRREVAISRAARAQSRRFSRSASSESGDLLLSHRAYEISISQKIRKGLLAAGGCARRRRRVTSRAELRSFYSILVCCCCCCCCIRDFNDRLTYYFIW